MAFALGGCDRFEGESCATYACVNTVTLSGSVVVDHPVQRLRATTCIESDCQDETVEVTSKPMDYCWPDGKAAVCADQVDGKLELAAVWEYRGDAEPIKGVKHSVKVVDAETGEVLLDEERVVDAEVVREDNCHTCWSAELEF